MRAWNDCPVEMARRDGQRKGGPARLGPIALAAGTWSAWTWSAWTWSAWMAASLLGMAVSDAQAGHGSTGHGSTAFGLAMAETVERDPRPQDGEEKWSVDQDEAGQIEVRWGARLVTGYRFVDLKKPVVYPVFGPGGQHMMRHYPLLKGIAGEATDHPHHKSIWFAHGDVNGHSYWDEKASIRSAARPALVAGETAFVVRNQWMATDDPATVVATEVSRWSLGSLDPQSSPWEGGWWLQIQAKVQATHGQLRFGDTKEGFFALRTHPNLRLTNDVRAGVTTAQGRALNSRGQRDRDLWGQSAEWVAYGGQIGAQPVTIVMMDHPSNLRHPTTWHARDYGLVAANPFGLHDFQKQPPGAGDFALSQGQTLEFCYRVAFLPTLLDEAAIWAAYREFAASASQWRE